VGKTIYLDPHIAQLAKTSGPPWAKQRRYEDLYGQYLEFFEKIAKTPPDTPIVANNVPISWVPLLRYLRCQIGQGIIWFPHDRLMERMAFEVDPSDRTAIETFCGFRPELVDALWKCDMQWRTQRPIYEKAGPFVVTNNGSFHRAEVQQFMAKNWSKRREKRSEKECLRDKVVILPCAADKPFPAPMHEKVLAMLPDDSWHAMIATGVCGLVDRDMWDQMPWYDSGIPNRWRVFDQTRNYFQQFPHRRVVLYIDFYSEAVHAGLQAAHHLSVTESVNDVQFYFDYLDLNDPALLTKLQKTINRKDEEGEL
jgi:hypothetical protein